MDNSVFNMFSCYLDILLCIFSSSASGLQICYSRVELSWVEYRPHSTTPTPTRPTRLHPYVRHARFPREDPREDGGVGVVECGLFSANAAGKKLTIERPWLGFRRQCVAVRTPVNHDVVHRCILYTALWSFSRVRITDLTSPNLISTDHCSSGCEETRFSAAATSQNAVGRV